MNKTILVSAIALTALNSVNVSADIAITNMFDGATNYATSGSLLSAGGGSVMSIDPFFYHTWTLNQQTMFMDNTGTWAGTSSQGPFDYGSEIAAMTANQVAVGSYWNWNGNNGIAHLDIFNCFAGVCDGAGVGHANGPAQGTVLIMSGTGSATVVPVPAAVWLMGSGLLGLVGLARRRKSLN